MRAPTGFTKRRSPVGVIFVREEDDDRWVVLAADPQVKIDNKHRDRRPHMHPHGWESDVRVELRPDLTLDEVVEAIRHQLEAQGYIDPKDLEADLT